MNIREQRIYRLELKLIQIYFKALRPRPVQLARRLEFGADGEAGEPNLIIKDRKRTPQELEALLKHELIHYELKDKGNVFHGKLASSFSIPPLKVFSATHKPKPWGRRSTCSWPNRLQVKMIAILIITAALFQSRHPR